MMFLNSRKLNITFVLLINCNNLDSLPSNIKISFMHFMKGIQEFHRKFVLAPADNDANKCRYCLNDVLYQYSKARTPISIICFMRGPLLIVIDVMAAKFGVF